MASPAGAPCIGIDLVSKQRIHTLLSRYPERFPARILGESEKEQWRARNCSLQYLAGRFAAKEAIIKSLRGKLTSRPTYRSMQIVSQSDGAPETSFAPELHRQLSHAEFSVSISHDGDYACAVALCQFTIDQ